MVDLSRIQHVRLAGVIVAKIERPDELVLLRLSLRPPLCLLLLVLGESHASVGHALGLRPHILILNSESLLVVLSLDHASAPRDDPLVLARPELLTLLLFGLE